MAGLVPFAARSWISPRPEGAGAFAVSYAGEATGEFTGAR